MTRAYSSFEGHVVIRVSPGGGEYHVFVLDDRALTPAVKAVYGPYSSN